MLLNTNKNKNKNGPHFWAKQPQTKKHLSGKKKQYLGFSIKFVFVFIQETETVFNEGAGSLKKFWVKICFYLFLYTTLRRLIFHHGVPHDMDILYSGVTV